MDRTKQEAECFIATLNILHIHQKYSAMSRIFNSLLNLICDKILVFLVLPPGPQ